MCLEPVRITPMSPLVWSSQVILPSLYNSSSSHLRTKIGLNQPTSSNYRLYGFGHCLETMLLNILLVNCNDNPTTVLRIIAFYVFLSYHAISFQNKRCNFLSSSREDYLSPRLLIFPFLYLHFAPLKIAENNPCQTIIDREQL